ncbi:MAG: hypothetical protein HKN73_00275 [Gemmatimonadetes bacterium]|nr:hypothetical protein [Gemmatimonadota bacterium]
MIEALPAYGGMMPSLIEKRVAWCLLRGALALGTLGVPWLAASAQEAGQVRGTVFDSVSAAPLSGAEVFIWNTSFRTQTDADGRFTLDEVPAGTHRLVFVHPLLLELGVSTGNAEVDVADGGSTEVRMATPSPRTILRNMCLLDAEGAGSAAVLGRVDDLVSDVPLPGARVQIGWQDQFGSPHATEAVSDSRGWFRFCSVPVDVQLSASVHFLNQTASRRLLTLAEGGHEWVTFQVGELAPGSLTGTLLDQDRGWGIEDAEVALVGTRHRAISGSEGSFRFRRVPPGEYTLKVSHVAYGERSDVVRIEDGTAVSVTVNMSVDPIELAPIEVQGEAIVDLDGIVAGGTLITAQEVEEVRHRARDLADILRMQHMTDLVVRRGATGELCVGVSTGQVRMFRGDCTSAIFYVDNARISSSDMVVNMSANDIDRIVVYRPVEAGNLFGLGSGNGVIAVYTKSGQRRR